MQPDEIRQMGQQLTFGYQLSLEQQRWLWNTCATLARGEKVPESESLAHFGLIEERSKCQVCQGTGEWGQDFEWGLTCPLMCLCCAGTGYLVPAFGDEETVHG